MKLYNFKEQIVKERINASNPHEIIYGGTGSGKSYFQMNEIRELLKQTQDTHIIIVDPFGEFVNSDIGKRADAQIISILPCENHCLDIFSLPEYNDSPYTRDEEIAFKTDRIAAMLGKDSRNYSNVDFSVLYNTAKEMYKDKDRVSIDEFRAMLNDYKLKHQLKTSQNFNNSISNLLLLFEDYQAPLLGSDKRVVIYDLQRVAKRFDDNFIQIYAAVLDDIWNRVHRYNKKEEWTFLFLEDLFYNVPGTLEYVLKSILYRARMHRLATSFATVNEPFESNTTRLFFNFSQRAILLSSDFMVRKQLKQIYRLEDEINWLKNERPGCGLIISNEIPSQIYRLDIFVPNKRNHI